MPRFDTGVVTRVVARRDGLLRLLVVVDDEERTATAYTEMTGEIEVGDPVVLNTTAAELHLGTGGEDFVLWNLRRRAVRSLSGGHVMKLRYTPWQIDALVAESYESTHHEALAGADSIEGMPVVACGLHSQIAAVAAMLRRSASGLRVAYVMTDGGALPIVHSDLVAELRQRGLIDTTVTCGHAFGGDLECVNVFSALVAARRVAGADVAVVAIGPGIVGTGTLLGHSGMEQGQVLSAAWALHGRPVAALRISFADPRDRHRVVSHHTLSALTLGTTSPAIIAVPRMDEERLSRVLERLRKGGLPGAHELRIVDAGQTAAALRSFHLEPTSMGRSIDQDPAFFEAAGAAGIVAAQLIAEEDESDG